MNLLSHSTKLNEKLQAISQTWEKEILPHLPQNLELLAQSSGILQRKRSIFSAIQLLKVFFLYAVSGLSFRMLAAAAFGLGISNISDTAWRKKYRKAVPFLQEVLQAMLSPLFSSVPIQSKERQVLLIDGSLIRQQGKQQYQQRIHTCYSLNQNRIQQVRVTDYHTAESFCMFSFQKEDIVLADAGYGKARNYAYAMEQGCDVILRISPNHISFVDAMGEKIDIYARLKEAKQKKEKTLEVFGFCVYEKKRYPVRLIAQELPKEQAEKARKRKQKKAQKNQSNLKEETLFYGNYVIVITSLGVEYDREEILSIYRSRWQIELLFKRFKQNLKITTLQQGSEAYAEVMVLLWMMIWIITEKQVFLSEQFLKKKAQEQKKIIYSNWEVCRVTFSQMKEILCMSWSLFVDLKNEAFSRYFSPQKRHRINQNQAFHTDVLPGLIA